MQFASRPDDEHFTTSAVSLIHTSSSSSLLKCPNGGPSSACSSSDAIRLAFSGAGLHGFYFNGVCKYLLERNIPIKEAWGSSAGALASLSVLMANHAGGGFQAINSFYEMAFLAYDRYHHHLPWIFWHGRDFVWEYGLGAFIPEDPTEASLWLDKVVNGRLHVVVTKVMPSRMRLETVVVNQWYSRNDLIDCIRASMTIPGVTAISPIRWRGELYIDGSFTNQHPSTDRTVLISTSVPVQPWAPSWRHPVSIFRSLPLRDSWAHKDVELRRDHFKLGYMDTMEYFESVERKTEEDHDVLMGLAARKPGHTQPRKRAFWFLVSLAWQVVQGTFLMGMIMNSLRRRRMRWRMVLAEKVARTSLGQLLPFAGSSLQQPLKTLGNALEVSIFSLLAGLLFFAATDLRMEFGSPTPLAGYRIMRPVPLKLTPLIESKSCGASAAKKSEANADSEFPAAVGMPRQCKW